MNPNLIAIQALWGTLSENDQESFLKDIDQKPLSTSQVCELLGCSKQTIWRYQKSKQLNPIRVGKQKKFKQQEVRKLMEAAIV